MLPNGTYYEGEFKENKPNGRGIWAINTGNSLNGRFNQNVVQVEDAEGEAKPSVKLEWESESGVGGSAWLVNGHENF